MTFKPLNMPSTGMGMVYLTPEQRRANGLKAAATKRARKEAEERGRAEARDRIVGLKDEIEELERQRGALQMQQLASVEAARLTGKTLLTEGAIVKGAMAWAKVCGIYFLVRAGSLSTFSVGFQRTIKARRLMPSPTCLASGIFSTRWSRSTSTSCSLRSTATCATAQS